MIASHRSVVAGAVAGLLAVFALGCAPPAGTAPASPANGESAPAESSTGEPAPAAPPALTPRELDAAERAMIAHVEREAARSLALLEKLVNINSGTMNAKGVRAVGRELGRELEALGFTTRWIAMDQVGRAGHLFATRRGAAGKHVLLIGHLDTVFEPDSPFQSWERVDEHTARGPGASDMKGGDVVIIAALRAMQAAGVLEGARITVAFTGDEEHTGEPLAVGRKDLIEAARAADVALGFEQGVGGANTATVARRGFTDWTLTVTGKQGHSSQIFSEAYGAGAVFEASRILAGFYGELRGEPYLTFNAGVIVGGTTARYDAQQNRGEAFGKTNVIPETATVAGDLRALSIEQRDRAAARMREIAARSLPGTSATLEVRHSYPPMAPTDGNQALFAALDQVTLDLGLGRLVAIDPGRRGAADISFAAPHADALAGLGVVGDGIHSPRETIDLRSLPLASKRAAVFLYRLTRPVTRPVTRPAAN